MPAGHTAAVLAFAVLGLYLVVISSQDSGIDSRFAFVAASLGANALTLVLAAATLARAGRVRWRGWGPGASWLLAALLAVSIAGPVLLILCRAFAGSAGLGLASEQMRSYAVASLHSLVLGVAVVGVAVAFVVAYASIAWLLRFVAHHPISWFVPYRVALGTLLLVLLGSGVITPT